jgi:hypothetical protein
MTALVLLTLATVAALQQTFTVSRASVADVAQETLQTVDPQSKQTAEVFPGTYESPYGAAIVRRISAQIGRVDELDRATLVAAKVGVGFDRSILAWRADAAGRTVALAVRYHRDRLFALNMQFSNDYGGPEPLDPADYEAVTVAQCSRGGAGGWSCREELLAAVATALKMAWPAGRADREAAVERLLEQVLARK